MRYQTRFPSLIPLTRAGCIRVTHPCAGRRQKCKHSLAAPRLACVKPVASVHPEPGSNSSLLLYLIDIFYFFIFELSYTQGVCYKNLFQTLTETSFLLLVSYYFAWSIVSISMCFLRKTLSDFVSLSTPRFRFASAKLQRLF